MRIILQGKILEGDERQVQPLCHMLSQASVFVLMHAKRDVSYRCNIVFLITSDSCDCSLS